MGDTAKSPNDDVVSIVGMCKKESNDAHEKTGVDASVDGKKDYESPKLMSKEGGPCEKVTVDGLEEERDDERTDNGSVEEQISLVQKYSDGDEVNVGDENKDAANGPEAGNETVGGTEGRKEDSNNDGNDQSAMEMAVLPATSFKGFLVHAVRSAAAALLVSFCAVLVWLPNQPLLEWAAARDPTFCTENGGRSFWFDCSEDPPDRDGDATDAGGGAVLASEWHSDQSLTWAAFAMGTMWCVMFFPFFGYIASKRFKIEPRALMATTIECVVGVLIFNILAVVSLALTPETSQVPLLGWLLFMFLAFFTGSVASLMMLGKERVAMKSATKATVFTGVWLVMIGYSSVILGVKNQFVVGLLTGAVYPFLEVALKVMIKKTMGGRSKQAVFSPEREAFYDWKHATHSALMELAMQMPNTILIVWTMADNSRYAFALNVLTVLIGETGGVFMTCLFLTAIGRSMLASSWLGKRSSRVATLAVSAEELVRRRQMMKLLAVKFANEEFGEKISLCLSPFVVCALSRVFRDEPLDLAESVFRMAAAFVLESLVVDVAKSKVLDHFGVKVTKSDPLSTLHPADIVLFVCASMSSAWVLAIALGPLQMEHIWV
jgi:hypothetical protein